MEYPELNNLEKLVDVSVAGRNGKPFRFGPIPAELHRDKSNKKLYIMFIGEWDMDIYAEEVCDWKAVFKPNYQLRYVAAGPIENYQIPAYENEPLYKTPEEVVLEPGKTLYKVYVGLTEFESVGEEEDDMDDDEESDG